MENIEPAASPVVEVNSTESKPQVDGSQQTITPTKSKGTLIVLSLIIFFALTIGGYAAYNFLNVEKTNDDTQDSQESTTDEDITSDEETDTEDNNNEENTSPVQDNETSASTELLTYTNSRHGISFEYPDNWEYAEETQCDPSDCDSVDDGTITVTFMPKDSDDYMFVYFFPNVSGPLRCAYSEDGNTDDLVMALVFDNYFEFKSNGITYRRSVGDYDGIESMGSMITDNYKTKNYKYTVCRQYDDVFTQWINPGYISYFSVSVNPEGLKTMDEIAKSFEYTGNCDWCLNE